MLRLILGGELSFSAEFRSIHSIFYDCYLWYVSEMK